MVNFGFFLKKKRVLQVFFIGTCNFKHINYGEKMKINYKIFGLVMFVMLVCCVSAASAADVDNITVPDDTDVIEIDDAVDSVEAVEIDEVDDSVDDVNDNNISNDDSKVPSTQTRDLVTPLTLNRYFNLVTGYTTTTKDLTFSGSFSAKSFGNFKISNSINIDASGATFTNIGFDILSSTTNLTGGTFTATTAASNDATIKVAASNVKVDGAKITITTPTTSDYFAINVLNANYAKLLNNVINYNVQTATTNYNHVIRVVSSQYVTAYKNNITAYLPLKAVDFSQTFPSIYTDQVAGVAVQSSNGFNFTGNKLDVVGNARLGGYPTLDALIIVQSANSYIVDNTIDLRDNVSGLEETNYLYAIDVYQCDNLTIDNNTITINSKGGNLTVNGTGAAYGIQLTGPHVGIIISNNTIITANNGPNLGIYSQNYYGATNLTIIGNKINVTGRAGDNPWALVSGMELQDTYAKVYDNIINVNNTAGYVSGYYAYGISYAQSTGNSHYYDVQNNTVRVNNGDYTIYLESPATGIIQGNNLTAIGTTTKTGNVTIYAPNITPGSNP